MVMAGMKLDTGIGRSGGFRRVLRSAMALCLAGIMAPVLADALEGLADPTRPAFGVTGAAGTTGRPASSALQSTFISASQRRAVINGRSYKVGDSYGGGKIADIQPYEVVVKQANRETRLRLLPRLAKQTHMVKVPVGSQEGGQNVDK